MAKTVICDGEVMKDDDPRYLQHMARLRAPPTSHARAQGQQQGPGAAGGGAPRPNGFDLNAPPLRVLPTEPGQSIVSTEVEVFGLRLPAIGIGIVLFLGMQYGLRGLAGGLALLYFYGATRGAGTAAPGPPATGASGRTQPSGAGAAQGGGARRGGMGYGDILNSLGFGSNGSGSSQQAPAEGQAGAGTGSRPAGGGSGAFAGRGNKLGS